MSKRVLLAAVALLGLALTSCSTVSQPRNKWAEVITETAEGGHLIGNPEAKVKLVEFASMTCPHCAAFDAASRDALLNRYIKSGRVSFEFRNYVRDPFDIVASLVARCGDARQFFAITHDLFDRQREWVAKILEIPEAQLQAIQSMPREQQFLALAKIAEFQDFGVKQGLTQQQVDACITDKVEADRLVVAQESAVSRFNFPGVPAIMINGELIANADWNAVYALLRKRT